MRYAAPDLVAAADAFRSIEEARAHHADRRRGGGGMATRHTRAAVTDVWGTAEIRGKQWAGQDSSL